jgi:hypothetical protein
VFWGLSIGLQSLGGAYDAEYGSDPDEAAHYVTGLLVRDYIAAGFPGSPISFAVDYYSHYPKVALGHWPPVFYLIQSAWTLLFSPGRVSIQLLMALLTAGVALTIVHVLKPIVPFWTATATAALFIALPLVQDSSSAVMPEMPTTLVSMLALIVWARYLEAERARDSIAFGMLASLAILTRQSAVYLACAAVSGVLLTRRYYLLRRYSFWMSALIVAVLCVPWSLLTYDLARDGWGEQGWGWTFTGRAIVYYARGMYLAIGGALLALVGVGMAESVRYAIQGNPSATLSSLVGLLCGVLLVHSIIPAGYQTRYLVAALPAALIFAVMGFKRIVSWFAGRLLHRALPIGVLGFIVIGSFFLQTFRVQHKGFRGFRDVANFVVSHAGGRRTTSLVCSDARGEGMFIAEVAMRDERPTQMIRRGSKEFASSSWKGLHYTARFADASDMAAFVRRSGIDFLIVDASVPSRYRRDYHDLVRQMIETHPQQFHLAARWPVERSGIWQSNALSLYRVETVGKYVSPP